MTTPAREMTSTEVVWVPFEQLEFDPENPRLPTRVNGSSETSVLRWMLEDESLVELMRSIGAQGYFPGEPLVVVPATSRRKARYRVVEGNRRLAAVILLNDPEKAPTRKTQVADTAQAAKRVPSELPTLAFADRDQILDYLGYRHVTGVKEWDPLEKARYVRQLLDRAGKATPAVVRDVALKIGSSPDTVKRLDRGLRIYQRLLDRDFYGMEGVQEEKVDFSILTTALSYENIQGFIGLKNGNGGKLNDRNLADLVKWLYDDSSGAKVVGESRQLRTLAAVVSKDVALDYLRREGSLEEARLLTEEPLKVFRQSLVKSKRQLNLALTQAATVQEATEGDFSLLQDIRDLARAIGDVLRGKENGG
jgi:ParB-like nuclease domain